MVRFKFNSKLLAFVAVMALAVSLITGCSQAPLESPASEPKLLQRGMAASGAQLSGSNMYVEQIVSCSTGATLSLFDVTLIVPPLAVNNDTLYSISIPDPALFYNDFGTNGLHFNVPVTVIMSYRDVDLTNISENTIRLAWFDEYYQSWQSMPCTVDIINKTVTGQLSHFSSYGLISD